MNVNKTVLTNYGYFNEKFGAIWATTTESLKAEFGDAIERIDLPGEAFVDIPTIHVTKNSAYALLAALKEKHQYSFLTDYTATDEEEVPRFFLVVHLMNVENKARIRIKFRIGEEETFPTLIPLWEGANWAEREIYDMFGIQFEGHPDLRRILMDMRWEGHPLRKDYPLRGYQVFLTPEPLDPELLK